MAVAYQVSQKCHRSQPKCLKTISVEWLLVLSYTILGILTMCIWVYHLAPWGLPGCHSDNSSWEHWIWSLHYVHDTNCSPAQRYNSGTIITHTHTIQKKRVKWIVLNSYLHHQLMRSADECEAIIVVEVLRDILPKRVACPTRRDAPPCPVVRIWPEQVTHGTLQVQNRQSTLSHKLCKIALLILGVPFSHSPHGVLPVTCPVIWYDQEYLLKETTHHADRRSKKIDRW